MLDQSFDAVVIGAGVIGCSVAHALSAGGRRVCVVERGPAPGSGSTSASSAVVRFNYSSWTGVASAWESKHAWEEWSDHLGGSDDAGLARFMKTGGLFLDAPGQDRDKVFGLFDRAGVSYEDWDAATLRQRMPFLDVGHYYPPKALTDESFWDDAIGEVTGYWTPDCGYIDDPQLAAHNLMVAAQRHGASFRFRSAVTGIAVKGCVTGVDLADGTRLSAQVVINAAGPHSGAVNALVGVGDDFTMSTRPMRQEVHEVRMPDGVGDDGRGVLVADPDLGTYFRSTPSGGLIVGGTEPECDPLQWLDDPDDYNVHSTTTVYYAQLYRVARRFPSLTVPHTPRGIAGVYDVSDDWIPVYDKTALPGYYVAIGTSGNQFKNAPVVGQFLTAIIDACENGQDHDVEPVRFKLSRTGHEVDLGYYSRRREIDRSGGYSVMG